MGDLGVAKTIDLTWAISEMRKTTANKLQDSRDRQTCRKCGKLNRTTNRYEPINHRSTERNAIMLRTETTANSPPSSANSPKPPVPPISRRTGYEMEPHVPDGRKLYVIDAENIAGGSGVDPHVAQKMLGSIFSGVPCQADIDHIVLACGITFAKTCFGVLLDHNWPKRPQVLPFA